MKPRRSGFALLALALLVCAVVGCKKKTTVTIAEGVTIQPVPEVRAETGWPLYEVKKEGFALTLPPGWRQFDMNPATFEKSFEAGMKANPELKNMIGGLRQQVAAGMKFFGVDEPSIKTGFGTNVTVLRLALPPNVTLETMADDTQRVLESVPNREGPVTRERVQTAAGDSIRIRYRLKMQQPNGQPGVGAFTQFYFVRGTDGFAVTLTTTSEREEQYLETFDKIGNSFRFIK